MDKEPVLLKESLFQPQAIREFADAIQLDYPAFDTDQFVANVLNDQWDKLELKARMRHITTVLHDGLPDNYLTALAILMKAAPRISSSGFIMMVPSDFVSVYGVDYYAESVAALEVFTQRISAEFAVRPFIIRYPEPMIAQMLKWAEHPSGDVRRLATEGCRPRLPWGIALPALKKDPSPILPILDKLKDDVSETVRRSVANNLNDIAKDNPQVVVDVLRRWRDKDLQERGEVSPEHKQLFQQALRTLIKAGHPGALDLLGFSAQSLVLMRNLTVAPSVIPMDGEVVFSFEIESCAQTPQRLVIDYVLHLVRAGGKTSQKVFKLTTCTLMPGQVIQITKKQSFRPITTRRYYPGLHAIQPKINGQLQDRIEFVVGSSD